MSYHGDIRLGDTIDIKFTTRALATGAPTTLAGSPAVAAYVGNGTTEITAGITLTVDFDARTGLHNVRVVATSGNGYAAGTDVQLVLTAGTVGGTSVVGEVVASFSIEDRSALRPATAGRQLVVDAAGLADANVVKLGPTGAGTAQTARDVGGNVDVAVSTRLAPTTAGRTLDVSATGEAGIDWANIGTPTAIVALGNTTIASTQKVDVDTIKTNSVVNAGTVTFPSGATLASTTNITAGTIATVSGNVNGNVSGSVGSVATAVAVTSNVKQSQALANFQFLLTDSTTHSPVTGKSGVAVATRSIDSGAFASGTLSAVTEVGQGIYRVDFGAGDLSGKVITLRVTATGCDDAFERIVTQP